MRGLGNRSQWGFFPPLFLSYILNLPIIIHVATERLVFTREAGLLVSGGPVDRQEVLTRQRHRLWAPGNGGETEAASI